MMLNLLFISDSPQVDTVKEHLQPLVKVIIDVVADFDRGMKEVLDKRPAIICIQDQIRGVTGESVARHIQMLLGSGAPRFILLHDGAGTARLVQGLFEHLVDLSQDDAGIMKQIIECLKLLLEDQWDKISSSSVVTANSDDGLGWLQSPSDQLAELLKEDSYKYPLSPPAPESLPGGDSVTETLPAAVTETVVPPLPNSRPEFRITPVTPPPRATQSEVAAKTTVERSRPQLSFSNRRLAALLVCTVAAAAVVYTVSLGGGNISLPGSLTALFATKQQPVHIIPAPVQTSVPVSPLPKQSPPATAAVPDQLPLFIPVDGRDSSYGSKNPGWERYVDSHAEFRTFTASGRLEAVQVLPVNGSVIPENLLATVLRELTGNEQYQIQTRSIKSGVKVECGTTSKNGDILVYRSNRGTVQAFVVSVK